MHMTTCERTRERGPVMNKEELLANEKYREWAKEAFVGNECDTDEYRESQPDKGLAMIGELMGLLRLTNRNDKLPVLNNTLSEEDTALEAYVVGLTRDWLNVVHDGFTTHDNEAHGGWWVYAGTEQLRPILELMFDYYWARGDHPYGADRIEEDYPYFLEEAAEGEES